MVESVLSLDLVFHSLADATRRDILRRLSQAEQTISALAAPYRISLAAIAKHVSVLEGAGLVSKERTGKEKIVRLVPQALKAAEDHLSEYEKLWVARYDALEALLEADSKPDRRNPGGTKPWKKQNSRATKRRS